MDTRAPVWTMDEDGATPTRTPLPGREEEEGGGGDEDEYEYFFDVPGWCSARCGWRRGDGDDDDDNAGRALFGLRLLPPPMPLALAVPVAVADDEDDVTRSLSRSLSTCRRKSCSIPPALSSVPPSPPTPTPTLTPTPLWSPTAPSGGMPKRAGGRLLWSVVPALFGTALRPALRRAESPPLTAR